VVGVVAMTTTTVGTVPPPKMDCGATTVDDGSNCGGSWDCGKARLLCYEKLWYLFYRYLRVSPGTMQKCMLHKSVLICHLHC
jgi:hypothetical protein